ncbi:MAG: RNA polymerase factor sigma-54, partial [Azonexaceae bacterium]|nr:RNA polymerase factor sigma-54 [Azonexaceae bacterium]
MKPALQLKLSQHLALTPQLQQSIKLLQLSTVEMQQEIERYLLENPMLEREDDNGGESFSSAQQFDSPASNNEREREREEPTGAQADDRDGEAPATPSEIDDDRWTSDAGTYSGAGRDDDDDSDAHDTH